MTEFLTLPHLSSPPPHLTVSPRPHLLTSPIIGVRGEVRGDDAGSEEMKSSPEILTYTSPEGATK